MVNQQIIKINTTGRGIYDISQKIIDLVLKHSINSGLCNIFCQHTSASLILCENYDPDVKIDIETFLSELVKDNDSRFQHTIEGPDDMPAHIRTLLTQNALTIPINKGKLNLGRWQGICLYEHRQQSFERQIIVTLLC